MQPADRDGTGALRVMKQGTPENPYTTAPSDFLERGLPYGAICKCSACGLVAASTVAFDFYAKKNGEPLRCESCALYGGDKEVRDAHSGWADTLAKESS